MAGGRESVLVGADLRVRPEYDNHVCYYIDAVVGAQGDAPLRRIIKDLKMYFPKINPDKCKNHGDCFKICPEDVFDMDHENRVTVARPGDCTKCDSCVMVCPEEAITVDEL